MRRGDLVTVALLGEDGKPHGKPRPALVIQSDLFAEHPSVTILPVTGELRATPLFRIQIEPTPENGLRVVSQVMVDKAQSVPRDKIGTAFGRLDAEAMVAVNRALAVFLGFA
ncbi:MAG: type II toxin-antitoxin system PemK/MazF family toxin [Thiobacillus sp.]|nr:type II toxin-antitoxin system PemK/MazF family toxin [Thiobacillus sp.]